MKHGKRKKIILWTFFILWVFFLLHITLFDREPGSVRMMKPDLFWVIRDWISGKSTENIYQYFMNILV